MRLEMAGVWLARRGKQMMGSGPWLWLAKELVGRKGREDAAVSFKGTGNLLEDLPSFHGCSASRESLQGK